MKLKKITENDTLCYLITTDNGIPVTDACRYLKSLSLKKLSNSTITSHAYDLLLFFKYLDCNKIDYLKVTEDDFNKFILHISSDNKKSFARLKNITATINDFYDYTSIYNQEELNHCKTTKFNTNVKISNISIEKKVLNNDDIEHICKLTNNLRDKILIRILFETGARASEIINLTLDDIISSNNDTLHCLNPLNSDCSSQIACDTCTYAHYGHAVKIPHSKAKPFGSEYRVMPISDKLISLILKYKETILDNIDSERKYIFIQLTGLNIGKQLRYSYISSCLKSLSDKSGLKVTPSDLRLSFILNALTMYDLNFASYIAGFTSPLSSYKYVSYLRVHKSISSAAHYINLDEIDKK